MEKDMTTGTIWKALVLFTVPLILSGLLQQIFNWVDAFIVGNTEGELALAGIGATTSLYNLFVMVITGFTSGICVLTAQQSGMRETKELRNTLAVFVMLLGSFFFVIAALKAIEDAGIEPKDVDFYFHGEASPLNGSKYITPNMQVANWFGMKGKGSIHHSEACCTGYLALEQAVNAVASGKYDVVLSGCVEFGDAIVKDQALPQYQREKFSMEGFLESTAWIYDNAYTREMLAGPVVAFDDPAITYQRQYGLTEDEIDNAMIGMALANRKNASKNPLALMRIPYEEQAKQMGFDDVNQFMRSQFNPKMGHMLRVSGMEQKCDGAAAVIVASTEWAKAHNLRHTPIEVLGIGSAAWAGNRTLLPPQAGWRSQSHWQITDQFLPVLLPSFHKPDARLPRFP